MKKLLSKKWVKTACDLCLAFSTIFAIKFVSLIIYGEPEYPTED